MGLCLYLQAATKVTDFDKPGHLKTENMSKVTVAAAAAGDTFPYMRMSQFLSAKDMDILNPQSTYSQLTQIITWFLITSAVLIVVFWVWRIPIMTDKHFKRAAPDRPLGRVWDSLYCSVMMQSTIGEGATALSPHARLVTGLQGASTIAALLILLILVIIRHTHVTQHYDGLSRLLREANK